MKKALLFYFNEAKKIKGQIFLLALSEAFSSGVIALSPLFIALLVDKITEGEWVFSDFLPLLLLIAGLEIADRFMVVAYWRAYEKITIVAEKNIAKQIFEHLTNRSLAFHADRLSGNLVADADKTTRGFSGLISLIFEGFLSAIVSFVVMIIAVASQAPELLPFFIVGCGFLVLFGWRIRKTEADPSLQHSRSDSMVSAHLADTLGNIETVIASGQRKSELHFYDGRVGEWEENAKKLMRKRMRNSILVYSAPLFIFLPLLFVGVYLVTNDHLSAGALVLLLLYSGRIIAIANNTNISFTQAVESLSEATPMIEILNQEIEIPDRSSKKIIVSQGKIEIKRVSFAYPEKEGLLGDFSLSIAPKERLGLVGPSGAGKSTLMRLLLRIIEPDSGRILVDDQDISQYAGDSLRQQISYVGQDPVLFYRTIQENISYGLGASDEEVKKAARAAFADHFIEKLPQGYASRVGDRGVKLSGGERQRIILARAFLHRSPILLLDEPTSSLDSYSEELIQKSIEELFQGRTSLVIAHRLSTIAHLDRIVVLDRGKVVEEGTHDNLLRQDGLYASLWQKQSQGFLP